MAQEMVKLAQEITMKLVALLRTDEEGDDIAVLINEFLINDHRKNTLLVKLKEIKEGSETPEDCTVAHKK